MLKVRCLLEETAGNVPRDIKNGRNRILEASPIQKVLSAGKD